MRPILLLTCLLLALSASCFAEKVDTALIEAPEDIAARVQQRYDLMTSLSFTFNQDTRGEMTGRPRKGSGKATFYRQTEDAKMRWDYITPDTQVLLSDGAKFYMYFSELNQMIVSPAESLDNDLTYSFFTGRGKLPRDFHIRPAELSLQPEPPASFVVIKLIPKVRQSQVQDIHLWITEDSLIRRIRILDHFGTITVLSFSDVQVNSLQAMNEAQLKELFTFSPPEGTEVIEQ